MENIAQETGQHMILLVEDEEGVRNLIRSILAKSGYNVLLAQDGQEAVEVFTTRGRVDLLLADIVMPGISGIVLAKRLLNQQPGLKIILMSGYHDNETHLRISEVSCEARFLQKPFAPKTLVDTIQSMLPA